MARVIITFKVMPESLDVNLEDIKTILTREIEAFDGVLNGEMTEEQSLDEKGRITERIEYTYENKLAQEKRYFDQKDRLIKKKTYGYRYREE